MARDAVELVSGSDEMTIQEAKEEIERLRMTIVAVRDWTLLQDDTVWFDTITTLHDFCQQGLNMGRQKT